MNVVLKSLRFVPCVAICVPWRVLLPLFLCLTLSACGNKGDLYLEPIELTDEQKSLLNELGNRGENPVDGDSEKTNKKKKIDSTESAQ